MIGNLYFIQEGADGPIKIGYTMSDPEKRRQIFQVGNSRPLRLFASIKAYPDSEKSWHSRFKDCHVLNEWFAPSPALLLAIEEAKTAVSSTRASHGRRQTLADLNAWLKKNNLSKAAFARKLGYSSAYVSEIFARPSNNVSVRVACRIEEITGGRFTAIGLLKSSTHYSTQRMIERLQAVSA